MLRTTERKGWEDYFQYGKRTFYRKKSIIYSVDSSERTGFYYLERGFVKVSTKTFSGEERTIDIVSAGRTFGEQTADERPYFSTAVALEDCVVYFFRYDVIKRLMDDDHQLRILIYSGLTEKLKLLANNVMIQSLPPERQLAQSLLHILRKYNDHQIPMTQKELSSFTGLKRGTIYKIFKKWGDEVIIVEKKKIIVKMPQKLKEIAATPS
ncbi:Crp/Fnr family transcriptional regulator [Siminovitchia sediminis]|uniref:Crp/Fnr family transcriptional regulator n=1 Tax=Siminovitchia sediminis TaxID=1274353 RepID=A0ABW4KIA0_9BACI